MGRPINTVVVLEALPMYQGATPSILSKLYLPGAAGRARLAAVSAGLADPDAEPRRPLAISHQAQFFRRFSLKLQTSRPGAALGGRGRFAVKDDSKPASRCPGSHRRHSSPAERPPNSPNRHRRASPG